MNFPSASEVAVKYASGRPRRPSSGTSTAWTLGAAAPRKGRIESLPTISLLAMVGATVKLSFAAFGMSAVALAWLVQVARDRTVRSGVRATLVVVLLAAMITGPWCLRGIMLSGYPAYPATVGRCAVGWAVAPASATAMADTLQHEVFPEFRVGLLHGKLKGDAKDRVMQAFAAHQIDLLVSTTVVEVGIDVPNATVMVVEHAERFGLAQLHQLRGRVGRGAHASTCMLVYQTPMSCDAKERLSAMVQTTDGFEISERDMELRGWGDFFGTRQAGMPKIGRAHV